jgi:hypothetical protein
MRNLLLSKIVCLVALFFLNASVLQADNAVNQISLKTPSNISITWGEVTNGFSGGARRAGMIFVYVQRQGVSAPLNASNLFYPFFGGTNSLTDDSFLQRLTGPFFLGATNSFCGPIELQDASGKKLLLLKPKVSSLESYPNNFSFTKLYENWQQELNGKPVLMEPRMPGDCEPDFLCENSKPYQVCYFQLTDYFKVEKAGEYKLIIWPKIYEQSETNKDFYERIDIPPVNIPVQWNGNLPQ